MGKGKRVDLRVTEQELNAWRSAAAGSSLSLWLRDLANRAATPRQLQEPMAEELAQPMMEKTMGLPRSQSCLHRVPAGQYCKRCD